MVQCDYCGALVPRSKAKKITRNVSIIDPQLARELREKGAIIPTYKLTRYVCIRCAVFYGIVKIRSREERKRKKRLKA
ncbi:MAG: 30S ribosomal protein S26e [Thermoprotei archaeon]|nr:MAG: 30S ribosomal protein S26e [Thermoprotei archaeon]